MLSLLSWNILSGTFGEDTYLRWDQRVVEIIKVIKQFNADIIVLVEVDEYYNKRIFKSISQFLGDRNTRYWKSYFAELLKTYNYIYCPKPKPNNTTNYPFSRQGNLILIRKTFKLIGNINYPYIFSDTHNSYNNKNIDSLLKNQIINASMVEHEKSLFLIISVHLKSGNEDKARFGQLRFIFNNIIDQFREAKYIIIMGDFNQHDLFKLYHFIGFKDAFRCYSIKQPPCTVTETYKNNKRTYRRLDYIIVNDRFHADYTLDHQQLFSLNKNKLSDHFPLFISFKSSKS